MKIYDISVPIYEGMPVYKNKPEKQPRFETVSDFTTGSTHETRASIDVHSGTHVDANLHMLEGGSTIESITIERLVRTCKVFDFSHVQDGITKADLETKNIEKNDFIILKTANSNDKEFNFDFIFVKEDGAAHLADIGIEGVGIDSLGIERSQPGHPTHKTLMRQDIIIIEGLQLSEVEEGEYLMVAAPLKMQEIDAAPARVLLLQDLPKL